MAMTKTDAMREGGLRGEAAVVVLDKQDRYFAIEPSAARENARGQAQAEALRLVSKGESDLAVKLRTAFEETFVQSYMTAWFYRHNELPEVKAANLRQRVEWYFEGVVKNAESDLASFQKNFTEEPSYAFEWGDRAMKAAADLWVAKTLQAVFNHADGGFDECLKTARKTALGGAREPSRSTSQPSNLMAQYKTAAFAGFAERFGEW